MRVRGIDNINSVYIYINEFMKKYVEEYLRN